MVGGLLARELVPLGRAPTNDDRAVLGRNAPCNPGAKGLTQERGAFLTQIHPNYASDAELGKRNISRDYLSRWFAAFGQNWATFGEELDRAAKSRRPAPDAR